VPAVPTPHEQPIHHVVVVVQENRSFDNLFMGFPGANTVTSGVNSLGQTVQLQPISLSAQFGIEHGSDQFFAACDGTGSIPGTNCRMDAFDKEVSYGQNIPPNPEYAYVPRNETRPYWDLAKQYVLADAMFTSHIDESFASHQYLIAAQAGHAVNVPATQVWGCAGGPSDTVTTLNADRSYGPGEAPCFTYTTIADELDRRGLPWRYYATVASDPAYIWSAYQANSQIYNGKDWKRDVITPPAQFLTDVGSGKLASVTWLTPTFDDSDHAPGSNLGPQWVASVVNAVGESAFWSDTVIVVLWDEWGGWYDHVPPQYMDYDGLGFRVPLLVISPYAKKGHVSHVQYEHGSIVRFIEDTFGLPRLAASDARATSIGPDALDFTQPPRPFVPIKTTLQARDFVRAPADHRLPDEN